MGFELPSESQDVSLPSLATPDGIDPRKKVAMALQYQRGLMKKSPIGDAANSLLQVWNMNRQLPNQMNVPQNGQNGQGQVPPYIPPPPVY